MAKKSPPPRVPASPRESALDDGQSGLLPKLRFPEFRGDWVCTTFDDLYSFRRNNALSRDKLNYDAGSVKNVHYGDIHTKFQAHFDITKELVPYINEAESVPSDQSDDYCVEGDLIFADASEDTNDVGKCVEIAKLHGQRLVSGLHTILARRNDNRITVGFGGHLFQSGQLRSQIQREAQGTKVYAISATRLRNVRVTHPSSPYEQQKIASCLSTLDELIGSQGRKVAALRTHKKGLMQQLFPREGETQPRLRFPEFQDAGAWEIRKLSDFITERNEFPKEKVPLFSLTIEEGVTPKTERYERSFLVNDEVAAYKLVHPNDFAFNPMNLRFGAIGRHSGFGNVAVSKYYNIFSCDDTVDSRFCEAYFRSERLIAFYDEMAIGTLIEKRRVHFASFMKFNIRFPSLHEQQSIASCLTSLDELITAETQRLEALKTHKRGLMQQLFPSPEDAI